ncbi:MAG: acetyl-CoA C-acyltransferase [Deltaproteobacteria bacterium]|nr:acetyl-CoA C-acyltransferase [Deltaproteobacteria bacterium]
MTQALIIDAVRTPIGRYAGALKEVRPDDLMAVVLRGLIERTKEPTTENEDVLVGCANQAGEDNRNVARMALLLADYPVAVAGATVNRLCGSGMEATRIAAHAIMCGEGEVFVAGGVESMTRAPFVMGKAETAFPRGEIKVFDSTIGWRFVNPRLAQKHPTFSMGETAENVAEQEHVAREVQDAFTLESQVKAARAIKEGRFADEIIPVEVPGPKGTATRFEVDEHPRADTTLEKLAKLKASFRHGGTVTAGNSSGINDGASALLLASPAAAQRLDLQPMARVVSSAVAGVDPAIMGLGPIPATRKALHRAGLSVEEIGLVELNEAFAAQALPCIRELGIPYDRLNVNGGGIALGHPLGSTGSRLLVTLVHEMARRKVRYGLATLCIGVGQGIAMVLESLRS